MLDIFTRKKQDVRDLYKEKSRCQRSLQGKNKMLEIFTRKKKQDVGYLYKKKTRCWRSLQGKNKMLKIFTREKEDVGDLHNLQH